MPIMLNMPRAVTVPFSGAGILAHPVLNQFAGQVLKLHAGLNMVVDEVAQHPMLRKFIVDERVAAPVAPMVPLAGQGPGSAPVIPPGYVYDPVRAGLPHLDPMAPGQPIVHQPLPEPMNPTSALAAHANEPDADAKAVVRASEAAKKAEDDRVAAQQDVAIDRAQELRDDETRARAAQAGAAPGAAVPRARPATDAPDAAKPDDPAPKK